MKTLSVVEGMEKAFKLIQNPKKFTTGTCARDVDGRKVSAAGSDAVCWCSVGALIKVFDEGGYNPVNFNKALDILNETAIEFYHNDRKGIAFVNDEEPRRKLFAIWRKGLEKAKALTPPEVVL